MKILDIYMNYPYIEILDKGYDIQEVREYPDETDPDNWKEFYSVPEFNIYSENDIYEVFGKITEKLNYDDFNIIWLE